MEQTGRKDDHDTAIAIIVGSDTSDFVLIRSRKTGLWRFPGDRIRNEDFGASGSPENGVAAEHAVTRIIRQRTGLTSRVRRIMTLKRPFGVFYGYVGIADFREFAPHDAENTKIFSLEDIPGLDMTDIHRTTFDAAIRWIRA